MKFRVKKNHAVSVTQRHIDTAAGAAGKLITEEELAAILGLSVKDAVKKAVELKFNRIPVKGSWYYSKRQVFAYLSGKSDVK